MQYQLQGGPCTTRNMPGAVQACLGSLACLKLPQPQAEVGSPLGSSWVVFCSSMILCLIMAVMTYAVASRCLGQTWPQQPETFLARPCNENCGHTQAVEWLIAARNAVGYQWAH